MPEGPLPHPDLPTSEPGMPLADREDTGQEKFTARTLPACSSLLEHIFHRHYPHPRFAVDLHGVACPAPLRTDRTYPTKCHRLEYTFQYFSQSLHDDDTHHLPQHPQGARAWKFKRHPHPLLSSLGMLR